MTQDQILSQENPEKKYEECRPVQLPSELLDIIAAVARANHVTLRQFIINLMEAYIDEHPSILQAINILKG
jgi:hypothetical protein